MDDLDQLSFINNSKNDCKRKEKQISLGESDLDVELSPLNLNAEYLFKKQKDLLSLVTDFGLQQMHELYDVKEKEIFEAGEYFIMNNF